MATSSTNAETFPEDRLTELLQEIDDGRISVAAARQRVEALVASTRERAERRYLYPAELALAQAEYLLLRHIGKGRRRFFPIGKTVKRRTGSVQRRWNPPAVDFRKQTAAETLQRALEGEHYRFVRWVPAKPELDLEAIRKEPELARALIGVGVHQEEDVRVTTPCSKRSYVLRGREVLKRLRHATKEVA